MDVPPRGSRGRTHLSVTVYGLRHIGGGKGGQLHIDRCTYTPR